MGYLAQYTNHGPPTAAGNNLPISSKVEHIFELGHNNGSSAGNDDDSEFQKSPRSHIGLLLAAWALVLSDVSHQPHVNLRICNGKRNVFGPVPCDQGEPELTFHIDESSKSKEFLNDIMGKVENFFHKQNDGELREAVPSKGPDHDDQGEMAHYTTGTLSLERRLAKKNENVYNVALKVRYGSKPDGVFIGSSTTLADDIPVGVLLHRLLAAQEQLLDSATTLSLCQVSLQSEYEANYIRKLGPAKAVPVEQTVHDTISQHVRTRPGDIAVAAWDMDLTYEALDAKSSALASHLISMGVQNQEAIGLCFEKSGWAVIAMLAVCKAGAIGFAIGHAFPEARVKAMMQSAEARFILTSETLGHAFSSLSATIVPVHEALLRDATGQSLPQRAVEPSDAAYILFTSGSTGSPKGIVVEHGALATSSRAHGEKWGIGPSTRVFNFAAFTFDVSVADVFTTLSRGATVCMSSEAERMEDLAGAITKYRANWLFLTPSVAKILNPESVPTLRRLVVGGEAASKSILEMWSGKLDLVVCYGPAETSIYCCGSEPTLPTDDPMNIGRPIGCRMWIVDPGEPRILVTVGSVGEIAVEGRIVSRRYLEEADNSKGSFLDAPDWCLDGDRMYRTGDLGRLNWDGTITILGRKDTQVKIRGQRVELGEIEHQLARSLPGALQTVALNAQLSDMGQILAVFFTMKDEFRLGQSIAVDGPGLLVQPCSQLMPMLQNVHHQMKLHLPSYMVPTLIIPLTSIPITVNGKSDRKRLAELLSEIPVASRCMYSAIGETSTKESRAKTDLEKELLQICSSILSIDSLEYGINDDFYILGGNSITAIRFASEARRRLVPLTVAMILEQRTIASMARSIEALHTSLDNTQKPAMVDAASTRAEESIWDVCRALLSDKYSTSAPSVQDVYLCTPTQKSLFLQSLKHTSSYIIRHSWNLPSDIDVASFKKCWDTLYSNWPILRSRIFEGLDGNLWQAVVADRIDWSSRESANLDCSVGSPLSRFLVSPQTGRNDGFIFTIAIHHALIDGWSLNLLIQQFDHVYKYGTIECGPEFRSFVDYIQATDSTQQKQYWQQQLDGFETPSFVRELSSSQIGPRSKVAEIIFIPDDESSGFTAPDIVRAAWAVVMASRSSSTDIVFHTTESGRNTPIANADKIPGIMITTLPFRLGVDKAARVDDFLQRIQRQRSAMMTHEQMGLYDIAQLSPGAKAAAAVQTLLVIQPEASIQSEILAANYQDFGVETTDYAVCLECLAGKTQIECSLSYDASVLTNSEADQLLRELSILVQQIRRALPETRVGDLSLLGEADHSMIQAWNSHNVEEVSACIHDLISKRTETRPESRAVEAWDGSFTYAELDRLSDELASVLRAMIDGPDELVPVCFEKSQWYVVALLGVLKAGAGFVPLDPSQPVSRLHELVSQSRAKYILGSSSTKPIFSGIEIVFFEISSRFLTCVPTSGSALQEKAHSSLQESSAQLVAPDNIAYVIFTSGSTGKPKGVVVEHRAFCSGALERAKHIHRSEKSRVFNFASHSFDTSIEDILTTLVVGGCVCIPSDHERQNEMVEAISRYSANTVDLTPSTANSISPAEVLGLETVILGGEEMTQHNVLQWASKVTLINTYGPSECSIVCTVATAATEDTCPSNIGRGVGCLTWVVGENDSNQLLPVGRVGELLIEGPIVARGYLFDDEKSTAVFIPSPTWRLSFDCGKPWPMYKTGDLVRYNDNGSILYIGRKDSQVKIRGQRVEPFEVEHALRNVLGKACVSVECINIEQKGPTLVAFLQAAKLSGGPRMYPAGTFPAELSTAAEELSRTLPAYMQPSYLVQLCDVPLSVSGKISQTELRGIFDRLYAESGVVRSSRNMASSQPVDIVGIALQALWGRVLKVESYAIGLEDTFFALGGDSLNAITLVRSCRRANLPLAVTDVFATPRLRDMASAMSSKMQLDTITSTDGAKSVAPLEAFALLPDDSKQDILSQLEVAYKIHPQSVQDAYPCSTLQEQFMFGTVENKASYTATHVFKIADWVTETTLRSAWEQLCKTHHLLRTRIVQLPEHDMLQIVLEDVPSWHRATSLKKHLSEITLRVQIGQPLSKCVFVDEGSKYLAWTAHHSIFDFWTLQHMSEQLSQICNGEPSTAVVGFNRFIQRMSSEQGEGAEAFWKAEFHGTSGFGQLFTHRQQAETSRSRGVIRKTVTAPMALDSGITVTTILRVTWALLLGTYMDSDDIVFGAVSSGRSSGAEAVNEVFGPTLTTVPLRVQIAAETSIADLLASVQDRTGRMLQYEHFGLHKIKQLDANCQMVGNLETILDIHSSADSDAAGLAVALQDSHVAGESFHLHPIVLTCTPTDATVGIDFDFDKSLLESDRAARMVHLFEHLLQQVLEAARHNSGNGKGTTKGLSTSATRVRDLEITSPLDAKQIFEWNSKSLDAVEDCIHHMVSKKARKAPDSIAIEAWDATFSYQALEKVTDRLARHLVENGAQQGDVIPLCFNKSAWTVVSMLAVLKAGGAYVALDMAHPQERLLKMVNHTRASLMLVSSEHLDKFVGNVDKVLVVDNELVSGLSTSHGVRLPPSQPSDAALIVFTSGSTGMPKGVILRHNGMCTLYEGMGIDMSLTRRSRVLQFAAYAFDVSNSEIFLTLMAGGCCCIPSDYDRLNNLPKVIKDMGINWLYLTPTATAMVSPSDLDGIETLILGGEAARQDLIDHYAHKTRLINSYGPAEGTIWPSAARFYPDTDPASIGAGVRCNMWLVDPQDHDRLVPIGASGEILLEGPMVAAGYLFDEAKTRAVFVDCPRWARHHARHSQSAYYKVGDLARHNSDGSLSFIGRKDTQIKLRGQRIELQEIEQQLKSSGVNVMACAVDVVKSDNQQDVLVAFLCFEKRRASSDRQNLLEMDAALKEKILQARGWLSKHVPSYMVPSFYVPLLALPTTVSGKLDRRQLRQIFQDISSSERRIYSLSSSSGKRASSTASERLLRSICSRFLHLECDEIGMDDSFHHLGGDSMSAIRISAMARQNGLEISVASIMGSKSLSELCSAAEESSTSDSNRQSTKNASFLSSLSQSAEAKLRREVETQCGVDPEDVEDAYPCTPLQEGLLALSQKRVGAYVSQYEIDLADVTDVETFKKAWEDVALACDILRTRIITSSAHGMVQTVLRGPPTWQHSDSSVKHMQKDLAHPFGHGDALARQCIVTEAGSAKTKFIWTAHHSVYDGWTIQRLNKLLQKRLSGASLTPQPRFSLFAESLSTENTAAASFWQNTLSDFRSPDFKLAERCVDTTPCLRVSHYTIHDFVPNRTSAGRGPASIQAAWALLLGQYYMSNDVVFGSTLNGRSAPVDGILELCGPTITTVPTRVSFSDDDTLSALLSRIYSQNVATLPFEQFGLQHIQKLNDGARAACDFETLLVIETESEGDAVRNGGLVLSEVDNKDSNAAGFHTYPIVLQATIAGTELRLEAEYESTKVSEHRMATLLSQFERVVKQLLSADPSAKIEQLSLTTEEEVTFQFHAGREWTDLGRDPALTLPHESCLHTLFKRQALASPEAEAIYSSQISFSYKELDDITDAIARHLWSAGVGTGCHVPICFEKSPWAIVAMIAVLKAGGAFVPLNPEHPRSRIDNILEQTAAQFLVCSPEISGRFAGSNLQVVELSATSLKSLGSLPEDKNSDLPCVKAHDSAYVIFTSGSTGKPKGVVTEHGAVCTAILARVAAQQRTSGTRVIQFSSYTFDMSIEDIFPALILGGTVCSPTEDQRMNALAAFMEEARVNTGHFTPSTIAALTPDQVPTMTKLLLMGEAMTVSNLQEWAPRVTVLNNYGPTEASAVSIVSRPVSVEDDPSDLGICYGCLPWLVHPQNPNRLAAPGAVAELLLEGPTLGREYLGQPERTAEAFILNPAWAKLDANQRRRFYKTGDLCRYNTDGTIRYLGRKDLQVKIRGQRIELGEIESCLCNLAPLFRFAVEVVSDIVGSKEELVAFVVMADRGADTNAISEVPSEAAARRVHEMKSNLEQDIRGRLPSVMIPKYWLPIHSVPLSASGKRDRAALQSYARRVVAAEKEANGTVHGSHGKTAESSTLRQLWSTVLKHAEDDVDDDDDFIAKGGDSILAMRLAALSRNAGLPLTVADIMRNPRFRDMAAKCRGSLARGDQPTSDKGLPWKSELWDDAEFLKRISLHSGIRQKDIQEILPLTDFQEWAIMTDQMESRGWSNYLIITLSRTVARDRLVDAVYKIAQHHPILRTAFVAGRSDMCQVVLSSPRITAEHEVCETSAAVDTMCTTWIDKVTCSKSLLGNGTLRLLSIGSSNSSAKQIVLTLSHAQFDGSSLSWLCDDLAAAYNGGSLRLRAPFSRFLGQAVVGNQDAAVAFWRSQLFRSKMSQVVSRPPGQLYQYPVAETHERIIGTPAGQAFTFATVLKAAWAVTLAQHLREQDVIFGHLVSGRAALSSEVASVMGPCINIVPVRVRLTGHQTSHDILSTVQQQHVDAMPHESLGFSQIIERCTEWPRGTRFSSIVQHQNMDDVSSFQLTNDIAAKVTLSCPDHDSTDIWVISIPDGDKMRVTLCCNATLVPDKQAAILLDKLVANIRGLVSTTDTLLASLVASKHTNGVLNGADEHVSQQARVRKIVDDVWSEVIASDWIDEAVPFYSVRGDHAAAFLLMTRYRDLISPAVTMEDLFNHSSKVAQVQLLCAKVSLQGPDEAV